jgi:choline dehydrogenase-like flavoprotein
MPFIDARELPGDSEIVADVVVIGAGMAGLTIAREWAATGRTIALIESGGQAFDPKVQDLYAGSGVMRGPGNPDKGYDSYLIEGRRRMLGGSGNIWGGKCVALDPADFARRDWVAGSGWPVSRKSIQPYYDRACDLLEVPRFGPGETSVEEPGRPVLRIDGEREFFSAPRQFSRCSGIVDAKRYDRWRTVPAEPANVSVYLNANVTELRLAAGRRSIAGLDVACLNGRRHAAKGRVYILAVGGIENARLLLASNSVDPKGVGNDADLVGRYFMGHAVFQVDDRTHGKTSGIYLSGTDHDMSLYVLEKYGPSQSVFAPRLAAQKARRAGNCTVTLSSVRGPPPPDAELAALRQLAAGLDKGSPVTRADRDISCFFMTEHHPNPESRVSLGDTSDALGMPRPRLEWTWSEADWRSMESSVAAFSQALGAAGLGRVSFPVDRSQYVPIAGVSRHHMGTTRMNRDPAKGVVDENSRVHGISNLYVAGSSVFPTSGIGNPTLTLLAMAMRLTDHLKSQTRRAA